MKKNKEICFDGRLENEKGYMYDQYAIIANNLAGTYRLSERYDEALDLLLEAKKLLEDKHAEDIYAYATILNNLALTYQSQSNIDNGQSINRAKSSF